LTNIEHRFRSHDYYDAKNERQELVQYVLFVLLALLVLDQISSLSLFSRQNMYLSHFKCKNIWGFHATRTEHMKRHLYKSSDFICGRKNLTYNQIRRCACVIGSIGGVALTRVRQQRIVRSSFPTTCKCPSVSCGEIRRAIVARVNTRV